MPASHTLNRLELDIIMELLKPLTSGGGGGEEKKDIMLWRSRAVHEGSPEYKEAKKQFLGAWFEELANKPEGLREIYPKASRDNLHTFDDAYRNLIQRELGTDKDRIVQRSLDVRELTVKKIRALQTRLRISGRDLIEYKILQHQREVLYGLELAVTDKTPKARESRVVGEYTKTVNPVYLDKLHRKRAQVETFGSALSELLKRDLAEPRKERQFPIKYLEQREAKLLEQDLVWAQRAFQDVFSAKKIVTETSLTLALVREELKQVQTAIDARVAKGIADRTQERAALEQSTEVQIGLVRDAIRQADQDEWVDDGLEPEQRQAKLQQLEAKLDAERKQKLQELLEERDKLKLKPEGESKLKEKERLGELKEVEERIGRRTADPAQIAKSYEIKFQKKWKRYGQLLEDLGRLETKTTQREAARIERDDAVGVANALQRAAVGSDKEWTKAEEEASRNSNFKRYQALIASITTKHMTQEERARLHAEEAFEAKVRKAEAKIRKRMRAAAGLKNDKDEGMGEPETELDLPGMLPKPEPEPEPDLDVP